MPKVTGTAASDCSGSCRSASRTSAALYLCRKGIDEHERRDEGDRGTTVSTKGSGGLRGGPLKDGCEIPQGLVGKGLRSKAWIVEGGEGCGLAFERSASRRKSMGHGGTEHLLRRQGDVVEYGSQRSVTSDFGSARRLSRTNVGLATTSERPAAKAGAKKIWRENRRELPAVAVGRAGRINAGAARAAAAGLLRPAGRLGLAHNR